ncbi:uncharacterized protein LOC143363120 [Halictus rubicundus]|uniref:uncharacterized protein LOC143363120 n=1 Tax=Halictus rubicundus TaxID=77578 RepID=UPI004036C0FD
MAESTQDRAQKARTEARSAFQLRALPTKSIQDVSWPAIRAEVEAFASRVDSLRSAPPRAAPRHASKIFVSPATRDKSGGHRYKVRTPRRLFTLAPELPIRSLSFNMIKSACLILAIATMASAGVIPAAPLIAAPAAPLAAAPIAALPAPIVTARSSQVVARNYNTLAAAPLAVHAALPAAPYTLAAAHAAPYTFAAAPAAPLSYSPFAYPAPYVLP